MADGAHWTVVHSYQLDLGSETGLQIHVDKLICDDACLSKVVDDKKSWFNWMAVLNLINSQFFLTSNRLGHQTTTSQLFQPHTVQTLALSAAAIHWILSEYASRQKAMDVFSQEPSQDIFYPPPMINLTLEATALIHHTLVRCFIPPPPPFCATPIE